MNKKLPAGLEEFQWNAIISHLNPETTTIGDYRKVLDALHTYDHSRFNIITMTKEDARDYYAYLDSKVQNKELSESTSHRYKSTLRAIARHMESEPEVFPGYSNPFSKLIEKDVRPKSAFDLSDFATYRDIQTFLSVLPSTSLKNQMLLKLMIHAGLRPHQLRTLTYANFTMGKHHLYLTYKDSTFIHKPHTMKLDASDREFLKLEKCHKNGSVTYTVYCKYRFNKDMTRELLQWNPQLGVSTSATPVFTRNNENIIDSSYIDSLVSSLARKANLPPKAVSPKKLCLYGDIASTVMYYHFHDHENIKSSISRLKTQTQRNQAMQNLRKMENEYALLSSRNASPGIWYHACPVTKRVTVKEIYNTLGQPFLYAQMGI